MRLEQFGIARQIEIPQARDPEAVRSSAQHILPVPRFGIGERAHSVIRMEHCTCPLGVQHAGGQVNAPVVDGDGHVEEPLVDTGKVKVEEAAKAFRLAVSGRLEQHVVAEEVAMARAFGQRSVVGAGKETLLVREFVFEQRARVAVHERYDVGHDFVPPRQAAQIWLMARIVTPGQMHAREHVADDAAFRHRGRQVRAARQTRHDGRRLAVERAQDLAVAPRNRRRHADVVLRQMLHQIQVERQLLERQPFKQGDDVLVRLPILFRGQEEIGVFDPGGDAAKCAHGAHIVLIQPESDLGVGDRGENSHASGMGNGWRERQPAHSAAALQAPRSRHRLRTSGR